MRTSLRVLAFLAVASLIPIHALTRQGGGSGARAELQQSLTQRYPVTEIGPGFLGLRGNEETVRRGGATVVIQRAGLSGAADRRQAPVNLIRGEKVEPGTPRDARQIAAGERFYVTSIYVGSDVLEFGLMSAQPAAQGGRTWAKISFLFPAEALHSGDRGVVFRELDLWFALDAGGQIAPAPVYAPPQPGAAPAAQTPAPGAATAVIRIEPGMTHQQVVALLGEPVRNVSFEKRSWLVYPGFVVQMENDAVKAVEDSGRPSRVRLRSEPDGAEIYLGEKLVGSTPSSLELPAGKYVFIFRLNGYKPVRQEVDVLPGGDISVAARMEK